MRPNSEAERLPFLRARFWKLNSAEKAKLSNDGKFTGYPLGVAWKLLEGMCVHM